MGNHKSRFPRALVSGKMRYVSYRSARLANTAEWIDMRVLLAEDDEYLQSALQLALKHKGYAVDGVRSGSEAHAALMTVPYDLVLLDLGLPGLDGTEVLSKLRARGEDVPVIVITARDTVEEKIQGLDLGANDYMVKPFDFRELEARIRAVLRKSLWQNKIDIEFGSLKLNTNSGHVVIGDEHVDLTPKETAVLYALMAKAGDVVTKRHLMEQVSAFEEDASENAIEILIHRLRKKLDNADVVVNTVRGFGYALEHKR